MMKNMLEVLSPDNNIKVSVFTGDTSHGNDCCLYKISYREKKLMEDSFLGLAIEGNDDFSTNLSVQMSDTSYHSSTWTPLYWDRNLINDNYNEMIVTCKDMETSEPRFNVVFRVYNEGVAFCYELPQQTGLSNFVISDELTAFHFPEGCEGYEEHGSEGVYTKVPVGEIEDNCERPFTVTYPSGLYAAIAEAGNMDFSRMLLSPSRETPDTVKVALNGLVTGFVGYGDASSLDDPQWSTGKVVGNTPFTTPWRVIIVGHRPGDLMERNYLLLNLSTPCQIENTDFIKPGKVIRSELSTGQGMACVDFAVSRNLQYIEFDAGWYGYEYDDASDARSVSLDPKRVGHIKDHEGLDLQKVINYAKSKAIGVILYVNRRALEKQLDELLPIYKSWGVAGLKFGFVNVGSQKWTTWLLEAVRKCSEYGLIVDIHDAYRPTGYSRTYPNLLTQEGIRGNEHMPTATHNTTLPFTRCIAGPADYTVCYYSKRIKTTRAHQLALSVVMFSPLQFLYWYSGPKDYNGEPEVAFFDRVPTVWDETKVIDGSIGEFALIARRKDDTWFIGCITNDDQRTLTLPLNFLETATTYTVHIYADGSHSEDVLIQKHKGIKANQSLTIDMACSGGQALILEPEV